jgi:hypothetical protein
MTKFNSSVFFKACKERDIEVKVQYGVKNNNISGFSIADLDVPHFYSNENTECVYHTICKKILSEVLSTHFGSINESVISRYLSSKDWLNGIEIIYEKIATLKNIAFKEWYKEQTTDLEKIKEQYQNYNKE